MSKSTPKTTSCALTVPPAAFVAPSTPEEARKGLVSEAQFKTKFLNPIGKTGQKLRDLIQEACLIAMARAYGNENYDYYNKLFSVVEDSCSKAQAKQVKLWIMKFAPVRHTKTQDKTYSFRKDTKTDANTFDFELAYTTPWYTMELITFGEAEALYSAQKLETTIKSLITRTEKKIQANLVEKGDVTQLRLTLKALKTCVAHTPLPVKEEATMETLEKEVA